MTTESTCRGPRGRFYSSGRSFVEIRGVRVKTGALKIWGADVKVKKFFCKFKCSRDSFRRVKLLSLKRHKIISSVLFSGSYGDSNLWGFKKSDVGGKRRPVIND